MIGPIKLIIRFIRSLLFSIYFLIGTVSINVLLYPVAYTGYGWLIPYLWGVWVVWGTKWIAGMKYELKGLENIPTSGSFIIAPKHQSVWDTAFFQKLFPQVIYVLKEELLRVPFFGLHLTKIGMICIDRESGVKSLKEMITKIRKRVEDKNGEGIRVVIFPQGTRTPIGATTDKYPYKLGIFACYSGCKLPVIPVSLNTGLFWPKKQFLKQPGTITVQFHPVIPVGKDRDEFMAILEDAVETNSDKLVKKGGGR